MSQKIGELNFLIGGLVSSCKPRTDWLTTYLMSPFVFVFFLHTLFTGRALHPAWHGVGNKTLASSVQTGCVVSREQEHVSQELWGKYRRIALPSPPNKGDVLHFPSSRSLLSGHLGSGGMGPEPIYLVTGWCLCWNFSTEGLQGFDICLCVWDQYPGQNHGDPPPTIVVFLHCKKPPYLVLSRACGQLHRNMAAIAATATTLEPIRIRAAPKYRTRALFNVEATRHCASYEQHLIDDWRLRGERPCFKRWEGKGHDDGNRQLRHQT